MWQRSSRRSGRNKAAIAAAGQNSTLDAFWHVNSDRTAGSTVDGLRPAGDGSDRVSEPGSVGGVLADGSRLAVIGTIPTATHRMSGRSTL